MKINKLLWKNSSFIQLRNSMRIIIILDLKLTNFILKIKIYEKKSKKIDNINKKNKKNLKIDYINNFSFNHDLYWKYKRYSKINIKQRFISFISIIISITI